MLVSEITVVVGAPASGKSAWVESVRQPGEPVVDYDLLARAFGSTVPHDAPVAVREVAFAARQGAISRIRRGVSDSAYIVQSFIDAAAVAAWLDFGARVVVVDPGKGECLRRAESDGRPQHSFEGIEKWYAEEPVWDSRAEFVKEPSVNNSVRSAAGVKSRRWFSMQASKPDQGAAKLGVISIYDHIGWGGTESKAFIEELNQLDVDVIELHIDSPGGDVFQGIAIMNALRRHKARIEVTVDGLAASIASVIAMAGDRIVMNRGAQMMIHDAWSWGEGDARDLESAAKALEKCSDSIAATYAARTGKSKEHWRELMAVETWFTAEEAVLAGLADSWVDAPSASARFDLSVFNYAGRAAAPAPRINDEGGSEVTAEEFVVRVRELLGLDEGLALDDVAVAVEDLVKAAEAVADAVEPDAVADPVGEPAASAADVDGVVTVDKAVFAELQADAAAGREARARADVARREGLVADAVKAGKISPASSSQWLDRLNVDEANTAALLASLTSGAVPLAEVGSGLDEVEGLSEAEKIFNTAWGTR